MLAVLVPEFRRTVDVVVVAGGRGARVEPNPSEGRVVAIL
jgi:hypothetical protein